MSLWFVYKRIIIQKVRCVKLIGKHKWEFESPTHHKFKTYII